MHARTSAAEVPAVTGEPWRDECMELVVKSYTARQCRFSDFFVVVVFMVPKDTLVKIRIQLMGISLPGFLPSV